MIGISFLEYRIILDNQFLLAGRPPGSDRFSTRLEMSIGRLLKPKSPGRKPKKGKKQVWCPPIKVAISSIHSVKYEGLSCQSLSY